MGSSFVSVGDDGFWMSDGVLQVWLRLLSLHLEEPAGPDDVAAEIRDRWLRASSGTYTGCVPTNLDEAVATPDGRWLVITAIKSLQKAVESGPRLIDADTLNLLRVGSPWSKDFETRRLIEVGKAFLDLIEGRIHWTTGDTSFMPGCR